MWIYITTASIIVICAGTVIYFFFQKKEKLAQLDLEAMKGHRQKNVKKSIVEIRMERNYRKLLEKIKPILEKIFVPLKNYFSGLYRKILNLEKKYEEDKHKQPVTLEEKEKVRQNLTELVSQGNEFFDKDDLAEAEKKYIEVLSVEKQNIDAYKGLAKIYLKKKDYAHAGETLEFIATMNPKDEVVWRDLGDLHKVKEDLENALKYYQKAMSLAPSNPKNIDLVVETALETKNKAVATEGIEKLKEVNPDNNKLEEYLEKLENL